MVERTKQIWERAKNTWNDFSERLWMALLILLGRAAMYHAEGKGEIEFVAGHDVHVIGCTFNVTRAEFLPEAENG